MYTNTYSYPNIFRNAGDHATVSTPLLPLVCSQDTSLHSTTNYHDLIGSDGGKYLTAWEFFSQYLLESGDFAAATCEDNLGKKKTFWMM